MEVDMSKNSIDKPIVVASETPREEFELDLLQDLQRFEKWKKDNPGKSFDDFLKELGIDWIKLNTGGLSKETLVSMIKNEYPSSYSKEIEKYTTEQLKEILDYLDSLKAMKNGGVATAGNYKKHLRKP